jgi:rod shape-determining protein MreD
MNIWAGMLVMGAGAILQSSLTPHLSPMGVNPAIVLLLVVSWSIFRGSGEGVVLGFTGGLMLDLLSGAPVGMSALTLMLVGLLTNLGESSLFKSSWVLPMVAAFVASGASDAIQVLILQAAGWNLDWGQSMARIGIPGAIQCAVLTPFVYGPMRWAFRHVGGGAELDW